MRIRTSVRDRPIPEPFVNDRRSRIGNIAARIAREEREMRAGKAPTTGERTGLDRRRGRRREVVCLSIYDQQTRGYLIFPSTLDAEKATGVPHQLISRALDIGTMHAGRMSWRTLERAKGDVLTIGDAKYLIPPFDIASIDGELESTVAQRAFGDEFSDWPSSGDLSVLELLRDSTQRLDDPATPTPFDCAGQPLLFRERPPLPEPAARFPSTRIPSVPSRRPSSA